MAIFNKTISTLERSLDFSMAKNRIIAHNIANVDTPRYKAKDVVFKNILQEKTLQAKRTHPRHLPCKGDQQSNYRVITKSHTMYNHNRNNVDIDREMAELAKNQIYYQAMVDRLNGEFSNLQTVIRGGN